MSNNSTFQDWENLVKKQLKVDDIYAVLQKENLENLEVKPFYNTVEKPLTNLPKVEESTHLVSFYDEKWEDDAFAFYINQNVDGLQEKTLFFDDKAYAETVVIEKSNKYISLIDVFNHKTGEIKKWLLPFLTKALIELYQSIFQDIKMLEQVLFNKLGLH